MESSWKKKSFKSVLKKRPVHFNETIEIYSKKQNAPVPRICETLEVFEFHFSIRMYDTKDGRPMGAFFWGILCRSESRAHIRIIQKRDVCTFFFELAVMMMMKLLQ